MTSRTFSGITGALTYDLLDHLTKWFVSSTNQEQYVYDSSGNRILRRSTNSSSTTMTVYAFGLEEHVYSGAGVNQGNTYYYSLAGRLIGAKDANGTVFYMTDTLGSILASFTNTAGGATLKGNQVLYHTNQRLEFKNRYDFSFTLILRYTQSRSLFHIDCKSKRSNEAMPHNDIPSGGSGPRVVHAPRGTDITCKGWQQEAAMRMIMNNLDPEVAERPDDLVVYGGSGRAARSWAAFDAIVRSLQSLEDNETLLVQSGKPVGIFRTHADAPRVLIANSNLVPHWGNWDEFRRLEALGLTMYGQMTAGSWIYIGSQGIVQGTYETFAEAARKHYGGTLKGKFVLTAGLGGMGGAQPTPFKCCSMSPSRSSTFSESIHSA